MYTTNEWNACTADHTLEFNYTFKIIYEKEFTHRNVCALK
jgi:hypothetical protein